MSDTKSQQEPSMEEILASIRRIISEDNEVSSATEQKEPAFPSAREPESAKGPESAPAPAMDEDVLELTQMVQEDGSVVSVEEEEVWPSPAKATVEPQAMPEPTDSRQGERGSNPISAPPATAYEDDLVSETTRTAASAALAQLTGSIGPRGPALYAGGPTLDDVIKDMLRPMLRDWLDENLPPLVERLVQREIEKMVRRAQGG